METQITKEEEARLIAMLARMAEAEIERAFERMATMTANRSTGLRGNLNITRLCLTA